MLHVHTHLQEQEVNSPHQDQKNDPNQLTLDEQKQIFQIAIEGAPDSIFWVGSNGGFHYVNDTACKMLGYSQEELLTMKVTDIDPNYPSSAWEHIWEQTKQAGSIQVETLNQRKDGSSLPVEVALTYIPMNGKEWGLAIIRDITERKNQEEVLRQNAEQLRLVLEATQVGIWDWNILTGTTYYDTQWLAMLGYAPGDLDAHVSTWESLLHPDDKAQTMHIITAHMQLHDSFFETQFRMRTKSGDWTWIEARGKVVERDDQGAAIRMVGTHTDITQRKQEEEELIMSKYALDNALDAIEWFDETGRFVYVNETDCQQLGYTRDELLTMSVSDVDPNLPVEAWGDVWNQIKQNGFTQIERLHRCKDGSTFPVEVSLTYMQVRGKESCLAIARDITERKRAEEELIMSKYALDNAFDAIEWFDETGRFVYVNETHCRCLGYTHDELLTMNVPDVDPNFPVEAWGDVWKQIKQNGLSQIETLHRCKDGSTFPVEVSVTYMQVREKEWCLGIVRDITERKRAEEELQRYVSIIEQTPDAISTADEEANIIMMNAAFRQMIGLGPDDDISTFCIATVHPAKVYQQIQQEAIPIAIRDGVWSGETRTINHTTGEEKAVSQVILAHKNTDGTINFLSTIIRDLTEFKQAEAERAALQEQIIAAQSATLRELSAPLLPISNNTVIMPLIGSIDSQRAQQIMETLLEGVAHHRADVAIIDITGVAVVDTQVANALIQTAQSVRLLGAQVVLTGIGPTMAQTLVHLGVDLRGIVTRGTVQGGIAYALSISSHNGSKVRL